MIITTTQSIEGYHIVEYLGIVGAFEENYSSVGREMDDLEDSLRDQAEDKGANAIVGFTYISASTYSQDEYGGLKPDMIAYGTAVRIEED